MCINWKLNPRVNKLMSGRPNGTREVGKNISWLIFLVTRCLKRPSPLPAHLPRMLQGAFSRSCISLEFFWYSYLGNCTKPHTKILECFFCLSFTGGTHGVCCFAPNFPQSCCSFFHIWEGETVAVMWLQCWVHSGLTYSLFVWKKGKKKKRKENHSSLDKSGLFTPSVPAGQSQPRLRRYLLLEKITSTLMESRKEGARQSVRDAQLAGENVNALYHEVHSCIIYNSREQKSNVQLPCGVILMVRF